MSNISNIPLWAVALSLLMSFVLVADSSNFSVGKREVVTTKELRDTLGLKWFIDGNMGVVKMGNKVQFYGANGHTPVRITGTLEKPTQKVEHVTISTDNKHFKYLSGGPIYRDPKSKRLFLFYHAEIHRGSAHNFYSVLGLCVQTDKDGLQFKDLGLIFETNVSNEKAKSIVEVCGSPFIIKDGYFYVYARDEFADGSGQINLSVARARVSDVIRAGLKGKNAKWKKFYNGSFSQPAIGGKSSPLEKGNPNTRWIDVSYNTVLKKYIMVVAANLQNGKVELFFTNSKDGITWEPRKSLVRENSESFYPSIVSLQENPRETGSEFYIYYTFSKKGEWNRWDDAVIARRKVTVKGNK